MPSFVPELARVDGNESEFALVWASACPRGGTGFGFINFIWRASACPVEVLVLLVHSSGVGGLMHALWRLWSCLVLLPEVLVLVRQLEAEFPVPFLVSLVCTP